MSEALRERLSTCCTGRAMNCPTLTDPAAIPTSRDPHPTSPRGEENTRSLSLPVLTRAILTQ